MCIRDSAGAIATLTNNGTIIGGTGGSGRRGLFPTGNVGGDGFDGRATTIINNGAISGGDGGFGVVSAGTGGAGVYNYGGGTTTLRNSGTISGGMGGEAAGGPGGAGGEGVYGATPVSYTHLDVYKRQRWARAPG